MFPAQLTERKLLIPDDSGLNPVNTAILIEILVTIYYTVNVKDENEEKRPRTPHFKNIPLLRISLTQKIFRFSSCAQQKIVKDVEPSPRCVAFRCFARSRRSFHKILSTSTAAKKGKLFVKSSLLLMCSKKSRANFDRRIPPRLLSPHPPLLPVVVVVVGVVSECSHYASHGSSSFYWIFIPVAKYVHSPHYYSLWKKLE